MTAQLSMLASGPCQGEMKVLQQTSNKLVLRSESSLKSAIVNSLIRLVLSGAILGIFYFHIVSWLIGEGRQTQLTCDRAVYPQQIDCEVILQDQEGGTIVTRVLALQGAKAKVEQSGNQEQGPYHACDLVLVTGSGENSISLQELDRPNQQPCHQAKQLERQINSFVHNPSVRRLTFEADNRHEPTTTWLLAGGLLMSTALLLSLPPILFAKTETWVFDRSLGQLQHQRQRIWYGRSQQYPLTELQDVMVRSGCDRWGHPHHAVQLVLTSRQVLTIVPQDYGLRHQLHCEDLVDQIQAFLE